MALTDAQQELAFTPGSRFVEACPGAGKTRALVARFEQRAAEEARRGIALLSFTNAAIEEVASRCKGNLGIMQSPHFLGTFDGFINRFITGPLYVRQFGKYPRFLDSWKPLKGTQVRVTDVTPGLHYELEWFAVDSDGNYFLDVDRVSGKFKNSLRSQYPALKEGLDARAQLLTTRYVEEHGLVSCAVSRRRAADALKDALLRPLIGDLLKDRFAEVIVDEAQDCGVEELIVLRLLRTFGVEVICVADLDQSIYEFRTAVPDKVRTFANELQSGARLDGNFRSSSAICAANRSLRVGSEADIPCGENADLDWPVHLLRFSSAEDVLRLARPIIDEAEIASADVRVLAHKNEDAMKCAGLAGGQTVSARKVLRLAAAGNVLRSLHSDSRVRQSAIADAKRVLMDLVEFANANDHVTDGQIDAMGLDEGWVRASALRICCEMDPQETDRSTYAATIRQMVADLDWPANVALKNLSSQLKAATEADWSNLGSEPSEGALPCSSIHAAKGREFKAVIVVVPESLPAGPSGHTVLDLWKQGLDGEARRVLYVGASRAEQLLVFAVHESHADRVQSLLEAGQVPLEVH